MSYFIFSKNSDNIEGTLYKIVENEIDFNNLNIIDSDYKIIQDSQSNFEEVKYGLKAVVKYQDNTIIYENFSMSFKDKYSLDNYISTCKNVIKSFLNNNKNDSAFTLWENYYNQLNSLNTNDIVYPLNKSLEQYFKDQNKLSLNPLQIP
jgi:hypothetical protein